MGKKKRRVFSPEFKAKAVGICQAGDRSIAQVAKDLNLTETSLRHWVKQAGVDAGEEAPDALTTSEKLELTRLRRELKRVRQERDILKAAATFFAKESE
jgi:transposase